MAKASEAWREQLAEQILGQMIFAADGTTMREAIKCVVADVNVNVEAPAGRWCGAK